MYHGTDYPIEEFELTENPHREGFDLCLTDCQAIAEMYATRFEGMGGDGVPTIIEMEIADGLKIATEREALEAIGILDPEAMTISDIFHAIDGGRSAIIAAGFDGVEYRDCLPGTSEVFTCTRIYKEGGVQIVDSWEL